MTDWRFAEPQWIHLTWAVLVLTMLLLWLDHRGSRGLEQFLSTLMHKRLVCRPSATRRTVRILLLAAAAMALIAALMRPQSGFREIATPRVGARLMVCLDVSRSMLAADARPNRLDRAKFDLGKLLSYIEDDQVGLIAFAGKATVLSPLTSDFGFLGTMIKSAGPGSVARGGTDLAAPIRKAVEGFRGRTDLSRVIILITDGEHHDEFVLDAAKEAGEQGVRIICIGFGDEAGSTIEITDPKTGATSLLKDAEGTPVISRLAGDMLRKIALATDGAYIPAGTGKLALESIYDAHIAPLTRAALDDHRRVVKRERYQWPLLAAALLIVGAQFVARPRRTATGGQAGVPSMAAALLFTLVMPVAATWAKDTGIPTNPANLESMEEAVNPVRDETATKKKLYPRRSYNEGVVALNADRLDQAEEAFTAARQAAGTDAQTRYHATYNLGWVEVQRADDTLADAPKVALDHLHAAEAWFRDAARLEPDAIPPRENMEIVARRALALADALQEQGKTSIEGQLDALVTTQRTMAETLRETFADTGATADGENVRHACQSLEVEQRTILSQIDALADRMRQRLETLAAAEPKARSAKDALRHAQLEAAQAHLFHATQRVGQTRRHLRSRQLERAYRRAAVTLGELKRSRDQMRDVVQILGAVVTDAIELTRHAAVLRYDGDAVLIDADNTLKRPTWLTRDYLAHTAETVQQRTDEIAARLRAGIEGGQAAPSDDPDNAATESAVPDVELLETLGIALPIVNAAAGHFAAATAAIESQRDADLYRTTAEGTVKLVEAHELFLDIPGLIETIYRDEQRILGTVAHEAMDTPDAVREVAPMLRHLQQSNLQRGIRLGTMFTRKRLDLEAQADSPPPPHETSSNAPANERDAQKQRFDAAETILASAMQAFGGVEQILTRLEGEDASPDEVPMLRRGAALSVEQVEALRRLFFSIVEHLRETLQRQVALTDETRDLMVTANDDTEVGVLAEPAARQRALHETARQIVTSLQTQSEQQPSGPAATPTTTHAAPSGDDAARLARAAAIVLLAADAMTTASAAMTTTPREDEPILEAQQQTIERLAEALTLLQPPPEDQEQDQKQDQQQNSDDEETSDTEEQPNQEKDPHGNGLLQGVRDRDAKRQQERQQNVSGHVPVDKDW